MEIIMREFYLKEFSEKLYRTLNNIHEEIKAGELDSCNEDDLYGYILNQLIIGINLGLILSKTGIHFKARECDSFIEEKE